MNQSAAAWDRGTAVAVSKDKNGIDQVLLQTNRGASAQVISLKLLKQGTESVKCMP